MATPPVSSGPWPRAPIAGSVDYPRMCVHHRGWIFFPRAPIHAAGYSPREQGSLLTRNPRSVALMRPRPVAVAGDAPRQQRPMAAGAHRGIRGFSPHMRPSTRLDFPPRARLAADEESPIGRVDAPTPHGGCWRRPPSAAAHGRGYFSEAVRILIGVGDKTCLHGVF